MKHVKSILTAILAVITISGCYRIPLHEPEGGVYIDFAIDYSLHVDLAGDVDLEASQELKDKALGKEPDMVHVLFYDIESHELVYEDYLPPTTTSSPTAWARW